MSYTIFISFAAQEVDLAEMIRNTLNKVFKNKLQIFLSTENIMSGTKWKPALQKALNENEAILTILTPRYLQKPWAYVEWAAFWLQDKTTYIVVTDDIEYKDIIDPMKDSQIVKLFSEGDVMKLFEAIAEKTDAEFVQYDQAPGMADKGKVIYQKLLEDEEMRKFSIYKGDLGLLPNDDFKKVEILWFFYSRDKETVVQIFQRIEDNAIKGSILLKLLEKNDLELIERTYEFVETKNNLFPLFKKLLETGQENSVLMEKLLEYMAISQTALRSAGDHLVRNGRQDGKLLSYIISLFTSRAELRKLGELMIDNGLEKDAVFGEVVRSFFNKSQAELQKLLIYLIEHGRYDRQVLGKWIAKMAEYNQRETGKVIEALVDKDNVLVGQLISDQKIIHHKEVLKRIDDALNHRLPATDMG